MIRFSCPACQKTLKSPDHGAGRKTHCPRCGQRLLIPPPIQVQNKTLLGQPMPESDAALSIPPSDWIKNVRDAEEKPRIPSSPSASAFTVFCPGCNAMLLVDDDQWDGEVECPKCGGRFAVGGGAGAGSDHDSRRSTFRSSGATADASLRSLSHIDGELIPSGDVRKHSGLGMASFIIALLVGGLDVILALIIVVNIARSGQHHTDLKSDPAFRNTSQGELAAKVLAGGMAMICLNCTSIPLCLVGVGLAFVGLIAHKESNHLFTWLGLFGNGVVILFVVGLYLLGAMIEH